MFTYNKKICPYGLESTKKKKLAKKKKNIRPTYRILRSHVIGNRGITIFGLKGAFYIFDDLIRFKKLQPKPTCPMRQLL